MNYRKCVSKFFFNPIGKFTMYFFSQPITARSLVHTCWKGRGAEQGFRRCLVVRLNQKFISICSARRFNSPREAFWWPYHVVKRALSSVHDHQGDKQCQNRKQWGRVWREVILQTPSPSKSFIRSVTSASPFEKQCFTGRLDCTCGNSERLFIAICLPHRN